MSKQLVFIDDSGDPGFKGSASSATFIMAGVVISDSEVALELNQKITNLRRELGWQESTEFKFHQSIRELRLKFLQMVSKCNFQIYAVYVNKSRYSEIFQFSDDEKLYNWATKELLEIMLLSQATVKMDGKYGRKYRKRVRTYIRKNLNRDEQKIANFIVGESNRDNLIQLADFVAGAINRSFQIDKTDSGLYIEIIKNKIIELRELKLDSKN